MTICLRCHRPLKHPTESGLGPVCAKNAQPTQEVKPDLFGYDIEAAALAASERVHERISALAETAHFLIRRDFKDARKRLEAGA